MIKQNKAMLGIWWSGNFIKIVKGIHNESSRAVEVLGVFSLEGLGDKDIAEKIKGIAKKSKGYAQSVLFVSRRNVIERFLEIPSIKKREIQDMITLQLEHHFPYTIDEMYYDFVSFASEKDGYSHVVLTAMSKNECDRIMQIISMSGVVIDILSVSSWGIVSAYKSSPLYNSKDNTFDLLIDSDYNETEFIVMQGKRVIYTRSITHEPNFTHTAQQQSFIEHVMNELNHTLDTLKRDRQCKALNRVILGSTVSPLSHNFKDHFSSDVTITHFDDHGTPVISGNLDYIRKDNISLLPFYSMSSVNKYPIINLLPSSLKVASKARESSGERVRAGIFCILLCLVISMGVFFYFQSRYTYLKSVEQELSAVDPQAKKVSQIIKKIHVIDEIKQGQIVPLEILRELYSIIPQKVYITLFEYDTNQGISLRGFATTITQVSDLLLILQKSIYFKNAEIKFAKQKIVKGQEGVDFEILCPYFTVRE